MSVRLFTMWGTAVLLLLGTAQYRGWSMSATRRSPLTESTTSPSNDTLDTKAATSADPRLPVRVIFGSGCTVVTGLPAFWPSITSVSPVRTRSVVGPGTLTIFRLGDICPRSDSPR